MRFEKKPDFAKRKEKAKPKAKKIIWGEIQRRRTL